MDELPQIKIKWLDPLAINMMFVTPADVYREIDRIAEEMGLKPSRLRAFIQEEDGLLYMVGRPGDLSPDRFPGVEFDSPAALALFFLAVTSLPMVAHQRRGADFCWECFRDEVGAILEWSRGFGKSLFAKCLLAYNIGLYPQKENLIIRQSATPAQKSAEDVAEIVSSSPGFRLFFPYIVPRSSPGQSGGEWSAQSGYGVLDLRLPPDQQAVVAAAHMSPSLQKFGFGQSGALGSRVTGVMLSDDLHDAENSESPNLLEQTIRHYISKLQPIVTGGGREVLIGTTWSLDDLLQILPETGRYRKMRVPITVEGTYPGTPSWPEACPTEIIDHKYAQDPSPDKREFKRNYLLNIDTNLNTHFSIVDYDHAQLATWSGMCEKRIGIDYASAAKGSASVHSKTAEVVIAQDPASGRWVIMDGVCAHLTQSQAEQQLRNLYQKHPTCRLITIEESGSGMEMLALLQRMGNLPVIGQGVAGHGSKEMRWQRDLEPMFHNGFIQVSDEKTVFLEQVRSALRRYPNYKARGDEGEDILDAIWIAVYHCLLAQADAYSFIRKRRKARGPQWWETLAKMK